MSKTPAEHVQLRTQCRICSQAAPQRYLSLPPLPLTDAFLRGGQRGAEFLYPIDIYRCPACGVSQTLHDVDMRAYYREYAYTTSASAFTRQFMHELADAAWRQFGLRPGDAVLEVGSGDGAQLDCFARRGARVFGFEPSAPLVAESRRRGVPVAARLFDTGAEDDIPRDLLPVQLVLLCYTFDHLPEPMDFLAAVRRILDPRRGVLLIEVHDLARIVERREFCLFEHEHTIYCCAATLQGLLARAGLDVIEVGLLPEHGRRANSLVIGATPRGSELAARALPPLAPGPLTNPAACTAFGTAVRASIAKFQGWVRAQRAAGRRLAGYGAGGRGVMTLAACARPGDFEYLCDQNPSFHGLYTPASHVPVVPPEHALWHPVDDLVVFSFGYMDEIRRTLAALESRGGRLVSLLELL
ncbi:MAG: class I SAM-dependent methyltransferase [Planctomycetota bacterium]